MKSNEDNQDNLDKTQYNIKYKTDFMCTYNLIEDYNDSFILYQVQLLLSFNTRIFDDEKINYITEQLYEKYKYGQSTFLH